MEGREGGRDVDGGEEVGDESEDYGSVTELKEEAAVRPAGSVHMRTSSSQSLSLQNSVPRTEMTIKFLSSKTTWQPLPVMTFPPSPAPLTSVQNLLDGSTPSC